MLMYHGTDTEIRVPDVTHSRRYLDFGKGFYLTTYQKQAEKWSFRTSLRTGKPPVVNIYAVSEAWDRYHILTFEDYSREWLAFVVGCRRGGTEYLNYDIIRGGVADDDVFAAISLYTRGIWDVERTLRELKYYKRNDQILIVRQTVLDELVRFCRAYTPERQVASHDSKI